jgi:hypothetical protein
MNLGLILFLVFMVTFIVFYVLGIIVITLAFGYFADYLLKKWKENKT